MGLILRIITVCTDALVIPIVKRVVIGWTRYWTRSLPSDDRDRYLLEIESDLSDQCHDDALDGYTHEQIAVRMLGRWIRGIPADLSRRHESLRAPKQRPEHSAEQRVEVKSTAGIAAEAIVIRSSVPTIGWEDPSPTGGWYASLAEHARQLRIQAQMTIWGTKVGFTCTPKAPSLVTDTRAGTSLPVGSPWAALPADPAVPPASSPEVTEP